MWKLFKRDVTFNKGKKQQWARHLARSRFLFAMLKFLRQTRHMRRRVRKRARGKKSKKKKTKKVPKSPLTLKLHMTYQMLGGEVGLPTPYTPYYSGLLVFAVGDDLLVQGR